MSRKSLLKIVAAAAVTLISASAFAQAVTQNVDVTVSLTSQCRKATATPATLTVGFGSYTAFQAGALVPAAPPVLTIECTRTYAPAPVVSWDTVAANSTAAGVGVVGGLQYSLSVTAGATVAGAAATSVSIGTPDTTGYTISGNMPGGQAGTNAAAGPTAFTDSRVLTLTF